MRRILILGVFALTAIVSLAQSRNDVTKFLGIPVDGSKPAMVQKLKSKGFTVSPLGNDALTGEFNGAKVNINVVTNNNKVCRIMVSDANTISETDIKIRFNNLCRQFNSNNKYIALSDYTIPNDEKISFEMTVNKKRYEAVYYQAPSGLDSIALIKGARDVLSTKYTEAQLSDPTEEEQKGITELVNSYVFDKVSKKSVWFMIDETYGDYSILMYYDNEYNKANGEDL